MWLSSPVSRFEINVTSDLQAEQVTPRDNVSGLAGCRTEEVVALPHEQKICLRKQLEMMRWQSAFSSSLVRVL